MKFQWLIAAPHSGAGKTTVTLGLLRALQRKGYKVQPFKCGPDFIDPLHHQSAAGRYSINLDRFMMSDEHIQKLYHTHSTTTDISITEGVMGLFDGAQKMQGSSADLALLLDIPVILVLNAKAMAYTAAALLHGLKNFCQDIRIAGVLFNFVDSAAHYRLLQEASEDAGVPALGYLPTEKALRIPSRYLGLDTSAATDREEIITAAADHIEKHIDLDALLGATSCKLQATSMGEERQSQETQREVIKPGTRRKILVARDAAFSFVYPENIRTLEQWAEIRYFSPLRDDILPPADLLYLPGGYPEWQAEALAANQGLREQIRQYYEQGGRILAECGGMMYLGKTITDEHGRSWPMTGILDLHTSVESKKLTLGYRTLHLDGRMIRGHEFHYSQFRPPLPDEAHGFLPAADYQVYNARKEKVDMPLFRNERLVTSYMHLYWAEQPDLLRSWFFL